ncbi:MAG: ribbon-helix-helix domain-containing protein [Actinomycetota bacterium]|nr:ribbon-helix-helix domain-containing protein [Actinomycetota bacterium]
MSRTQIYLGDGERELLVRMSKATGASASELIRRAIRSTYRLELTTEEKLRLLESSAGSWKDRDFTGAEYVDAIRGGDMNEGFRRLDVE